jgi:hypothetical protein
VFFGGGGLREGGGLIGCVSQWGVLGMLGNYGGVGLLCEGGGAVRWSDWGWVGSDTGKVVCELGRVQGWLLVLCGMCVT